MLRLKRASAGSGKTFQLAKTYIKMLLTYKKENDPRQLRNEATIHDALKGIMAVTFTVKATAEMKQRIVEKLADLAQADNKSGDELKNIDYLGELEKDLNTNRFEIARLSRKALRTLLLHFSDFKVQTIDSFFQSILHTFAYEASLVDDFNMEIDTDYIATVGLDTTLNELSVDSSRGDSETLHWLRKMMSRSIGSKKWNVFTREAGESYLYGQLIQEAGNLEKEDYQQIREELENYFNHLDRPFREIVKEVEEANYSGWEALHDARYKAAEELKQILDKAGLESKDLYSRNGSKLEMSLSEFDRDNLRVPKTPVAKSEKLASGYSLSGNGLKEIKNRIKRDPDTNSSILHEIDGAYDAWMEAANQYYNQYEARRKALHTWNAYREILPKLMLVLEIARQKDAYLRSTNSLQISETNRILKEIIGGEDTPFVYERMGSRLNHYLIDEFQDTSRMQWDNLLPLLLESDGNGHDNLIIGDAKQSIYRFRNADYRLIQTIGNMTGTGGFNKVVDYTTEKEPEDRSKENTNFRSKQSVVEMNNAIFSSIVDLKRVAKKNMGTPLFNPSIVEIYNDCVQALPGKKEGEEPPRGYVEINLIPGPDKTEENEAEKSGTLSLAIAGFRDLPERIMELKRRGYGYGDIGILVKTHKVGQAAMKALTLYNELHKDAPIPVISEENLLVASAFSVKMVIHALEIVADGYRSGVKKSAVAANPIDEDALFELLKSLQTLALPSVVEAILEKFVPEDRRMADSYFITAFLDAVLDYSSTHTGDIGSFLKWWQQKSKKLSINSPEDSEGVRLHTIHQAKGLEYKCVIIPYGAFSFFPGNEQTEWRWVRPENDILKKELLPPFLPVETSTALRDTLHESIRDTYEEEFALDELNKMYVGFTRAVNELYVYMPTGKTVSDHRGADAIRRLLEGDAEGKALSMLDGNELKIEELPDGGITIRYGTPLTTKEIKTEKEAEKLKSLSGLKAKKVLATYRINSGKGMIKFREDNKLRKSPVHTGTDEDDIDPRAEGTLKHRIMQMIETPEDLDKAMREMKVGGLISKRQLEEWRKELHEAIEGVAEYGWFAPDLTVLNERPIMANGENTRPDRIVVTPENDAIVIDYKFGEEESGHKTQVAEYSDLLIKSGAFRNVSAYLWYLTKKMVVPVIINGKSCQNIN